MEKNGYVVSHEDEDGTITNPLNFTLDIEKKESKSLEIDFLSGSKMSQEIDIFLKRSVFEIDLDFR